MTGKTGAFSIAASFIGSIIGAGFVSGQELWLYFGSYGKSGFFGLLVSVFLLSAITVLVFRIAVRTGAASPDAVLFSHGCPAVLRKIFGAVFLFSYFCITTVMLAGVSSLGTQLLGMPRYLGGLIAAVLIMAVTYFGLRGMTIVFDFCIPVLVVSTILISLIRLRSAGLSSVIFSEEPGSMLLGSYLSSAVNYASYNIFASIGILSPLAPFLKSEKSACIGSAAGGVFLALIAGFILLSLCSCPESVAADLPMMDLAIRMGSIFAVSYGILLFLGMFGSGMSTLVAMNSYLQNRFPSLNSCRLSLLLVTGTASYLLSLCGFADLVATVYPVMGYIGFVSVFLVILRIINLRKCVR